MRCPHCNRLITNSQRRSTVFESSARSPLRQTAAPPMYPPPVSIAHPIGHPTMEANVHVPANQAIITGCLFAPVVGLTVYTICIFGKLSGTEAAGYGIIVGGIALFGTATWQWLSKTAFYDSLLQTVETAFDVDLDGDGEIGQTAIKTEVRVNNNWVYADLPHDRGNEKALVDFLAAVVQGVVTFSERGAISSGYNVDRFKELRAVFIKSGFAYRTGKADNSPLQFTTTGKALMRDVVQRGLPENYEGDGRSEGEGNRGMSGNYIERGSRRESWG